FESYRNPEMWRLYSETEEVLAALSPRYRLGVISNFDRRFHDIATGLGIEKCFNVVSLSGEIGAAKPDGAIFHFAEARLGLPRERILHVGDEPEADWWGARKAGFQVFELLRPESSLRDLLTELL
ncbi:MAG: HAD-IA family hydrolase, partial [Verrucomicrobiae bacterium]|nr:HAD-IA family hydrolase [Verrucomicrobiae bacterium]